MEISIEIIPDLIARGAENSTLYYSWSKKCYLTTSYLFNGFVNSVKDSYPKCVETHKEKGTDRLFIFKEAAKRVTLTFQKANDMAMQLLESKNPLMGENTMQMVYNWQQDTYDTLSMQMEKYIMESPLQVQPQMQLVFSNFIENAFKRGKRQPGGEYDKHLAHVTESIEDWYQATNTQEPEVATGE